MSNRANRINIDLGFYKQPWIAYCRARGESPSSAFRQLAAKLLADGATVAPAALPVKATVRKEIRLTPEEQAHVLNAARQAGMRDVRWIAALVRANMQSQPQLGQAEMQALGRSNLALLAIGRNLNQLARVANDDGAMVQVDLVPVLVALRVQLSSHIDSVAQLLSANQQRWRVK